LKTAKYSLTLVSSGTEAGKVADLEGFEGSRKQTRLFNHNFIKCLSQLTVQKLPGVLETHVRRERRLLREPLSTQGAFKLGFLSALVLYVAPQARIVFVGFLAEAAKKLIVEPHPKP
jgi:hypothetical protein